MKLKENRNHGNSWSSIATEWEWKKDRNHGNSWSSIATEWEWKKEESNNNSYLNPHWIRMKERRK